MPKERTSEPVYMSIVYCEQTFFIYQKRIYLVNMSFHCAKKASNHHANLPLEMYSFTL